MKKPIALIPCFLLTILLFGCVTMDSRSDPKGNLSVVNKSGSNVILFINGDEYKDIPTEPEPFKVSLTPEMAENTNKTVQIAIYPKSIFEQDNYTLTANIKDKFVFSQQIRSDSTTEFEIQKKNITYAESDQDDDKNKNQEFLFTFSAGAKPYLVELYSDKNYVTRFVAGSLMPGDTISAFKSLETVGDVTIYARYIRNDEKGGEEIAKGQVGESIPLGGSRKTINIPADPKDLTNPKFSETENPSHEAKLIIKNTTDNTIIVNLDDKRTRIEDHEDFTNLPTSSSYIQAETKKEYKRKTEEDSVSYTLFMSSDEIIKRADIELEPSEDYYISFPGKLSTGTQLKESDLERKINITSNVPLATIFYTIKTEDPEIFIENPDDIELGSTSETRRPYLSTQITLPVSGLTYDNSINAKITIIAEKEGYYRQMKSLNLQTYIDLEQEITFERFILEEVSF